QTVQSLEEPQPHDVHLKEAGHRAPEDLERPRPPALLVELRGAPLAVDLDLPPVLPEGAKGVVLERVPEDRQRSRKIDLGMHLTVLVAREVAAEQPNHLVGAPSAAPHPSPEKMIGAQDPISVVFRSRPEQCQDLLLEAR